MALLSGNNNSRNNINIEQIISNVIMRFLRENPPPPGPPGPLGEPGPPGESPVSGPQSPRFNPGDIGFFNPFYNNKSADTGLGIEHTSKETFFQDVIVFINRIKDVSYIKGTDLVYSNL